MSRSADRPSTVASALGWANLIYLGLLPALGTFAVVYRHGSPEIPGLGEDTRAAIGVVGFAAVAVELAVLVTYTRFPTSGWTALLVLADGPALALIGCRSDPSPLDFAIRAFLIDGTAVWLSIGVLATTTRALRRKQRKIPVAMMLAMLVCIVGLFWPYLAHDVPRTWDSIATLVGGLVWATIVNHRVLSADDVARKGSSGPVMAYLLGLAFAWLAAYGVGIALH